jgi:hypothetical protein
MYRALLEGNKPSIKLIRKPLFLQKFDETSALSLVPVGVIASLGLIGDILFL